MAMFDEKAPLFSLLERQNLWTQAHREASARMVRVLVRLRLAADVASAQERVRLAEDRALRPRRITLPRPGFWQRALFMLSERASAHAPPPEPERTGSEVEVAHEQLQRLLTTDGPTLLQHAEFVAQALEDRAATHAIERTFIEKLNEDSACQARRAPRSQERPRRPPLDLEHVTDGEGAKT